MNKLTRDDFNKTSIESFQQIEGIANDIEGKFGKTYKIACTYSHEADALEFSPMRLETSHEIACVGDDKLIGVWVIDSSDYIVVLGMIQFAYHQNMKLKNKAKYLARMLDENFKRFSLLDIN